MSGSIKHFSITYEPINESNTFTNGDTIQGEVIVEVNKELRMDKLYIKCKGDANVVWSESNTDNSDDYYRAHERYFKLKQIMIWDKSKIDENGATLVTTNGEKYNNLVMPGYHAFPFSFQLPHGNTPSSFKGSYGAITYVLQAKLSRSWKLTQTIQKEFAFVSNIFESAADLMSPLSGSLDKKMKLFTFGSASVRASTDKKGYMPGERIKVETHIENCSSRALKLKFKFEQRQTFFAQSRKKHDKKVIFKAVEDPIPSKSKKTFTSRLKIPCNLDLAISNCNIIKVEYILKVYLDVPYARDPEIILPLVIIPTGWYGIPHQSQGASHASQSTHEAMRRGSTFQPAIVSFPNSPPDVAFGPAPNVYPSVYPPPANPEEQPPSYADIFPDLSASGFIPSLLHLRPPPYNPINLSHASQHLTPGCPNTAGYLQSPANAKFYPTQ